MRRLWRWQLVACLSLVAFCIAAVALGRADGTRGAGPTGQIDTFAGGGRGDGDTRLNVSVAPGGVAVDPTTGDLIQAEREFCRVRRITPTVVTTIAGNGYCGFSGDGGSPTAGMIDGPNDVAVTATGSLYIAEYYGCRIRFVGAGVIQTVAGTGVCAEGADGPALSVSIQPWAIELDSAGDLLITENCRIRKLSGGAITTIAGSAMCGDDGDGGPATSAGLNSLSGITVDGAGDIYFSQLVTCRVRKISGGIVTNFAGDGSCFFGPGSGDGGPAAAAEIFQPGVLDVDTTGALYIAETGNCRIRKVSAGIISTYVGTGVLQCATGGDGGLAVDAQINEPNGIALDASDSLYISQQDNCRVRVVTGGMIDTYAGFGACSFYGDGGSATDGALYYPRAVAVDASGDVYISDGENCRIRKVSGGVITTIAGHAGTGYRYCATDGSGGPATSAGLAFPGALAVAPNGDLYVGAGCVVRRISGGTMHDVAGIAQDCGFTGDGGPAVNAKIENVNGLAFAPNGDLYIADYSCRLRRVSSGIISTAAGTGTCGFTGDGGAPTSAQIREVGGIAIDASSRVFISQGHSSTGCRVRMIASGTISTVIGNGTCDETGDGGDAMQAAVHPGSLAFSPAGDLYIGTDCVIRVVHGGVIDRIAGSYGDCWHGMDGDGGPAIAARLRDAGGMAFDSAGNLYVADSGAQRVRIIHNADDYAGTPTRTGTATATGTPTFTASPTRTITPTSTATRTPTRTFTPSATPSTTPTPGNSPTPTQVPGGMRVHVHDIDARVVPGLVYGWRMEMKVYIYDALERPVRGATVHAMFTGNQLQVCQTDVYGACTVLNNTKYEPGTVYGWVRNVTREAVTYYNAANHDIDGETNGTSTSVTMAPGTPTVTSTPTQTPTVTPTPTQVAGALRVHVHDIDAFAEDAIGWWRMKMIVRVYDALERPVAGATVHAAFSGGQSATCVTNAVGTCTVYSGPRGGSATIFGWVKNVTRSGVTYYNPANHDFDGSTNGTSTSVTH